jgi:hypothetical protein
VGSALSVGVDPRYRRGMSMTEQAELTTRELRARPRVSRALVLVVGVFVVPFVLMLAFTSYNTVTAESALRQAFAGVAGQTVAIVSALTVVAMTALARRWRELPLFAVIAVAVCTAAVNSMTGTGEQLFWLLSGRD